LVGKPNVILYKNDSPNSAASCRPIRVAYERESRESIQQESTRLIQDEASLKPFAYSLDPPVNVHYKGFLTMIDGKVLQVGNELFY